MGKIRISRCKGLITDRLFEGLPIVAAISVQEVQEKIKPYIQAGGNPSYLALCSLFIWCRW